MGAALIQTHLEARFGHPVACLQVGMFAGRQNKVLLFGFREGEARPFVVCRVSRTPAGIRSLRREALVRKRLSALVSDQVAWLELVELPDGCFLFEPFSQGVAFKPATTLDELNAYGMVTMRWLRAFRHGTTDASRSESPIASQIDQCLERVIAALGAGPEGAWLERVRSQASLLQGTSPCAMHGDFWRGNVRVEGTALRVFDWEFTEVAGNPYFDLLLNLVTLTRELPGSDEGSGFERCFLRPTPYSRLLGAILGQFEPDASAHPAVAFSLVHVIVELVRRDVDDGMEPRQSPHFRYLARISQVMDPVASVLDALWPNR